MLAVNGYVLISVQDPGEPGWSYTIGLTEKFDHPELVCLDIELETRSRLIRMLADTVRDDGALDQALLEELDIELLPVTPSPEVFDLVGQFVDWYDRLPGPGEYQQVVLGPSWLCDGHVRAQRRLDRP